MNLHEECLLKYLLNPLDLMRSTEMLKINNRMIKDCGKFDKFLLEEAKIGCTRI